MTNEEVRHCADLWRRRLGDRALEIAQVMERVLIAKGDAEHADEWRRIIAVLQGHR